MEDTADYWLFYFRSPFPAPRSPFLVLVTSLEASSFQNGRDVTKTRNGERGAGSGERGTEVK